jgi:CubicO group peptidase (beta-lactamase class C family)
MEETAMCSAPDYTSVQQKALPLTCAAGSQRTLALTTSSAIGLLLAISTLGPAQQPVPSGPVLHPDAFRLVDSIAEAEFAKDRLGSVTVGLVSGRDLVWAKSYGYEDRARTRPATPASVYRIASVTKQVTTVMLLQLVEQKRVQLNDRVDKYFPEIRRVNSPFGPIDSPTLVQLATMTSGLARDPADRQRFGKGLPSDWLAVLDSALPNTSYLRLPGTGYGYSNVGFSILGAAIARAAQESYKTYVARHILAPLGMSSTGFDLTPAMREHLAEGVDYDTLIKDTLNYADAAEGHRTGPGLAVPAGGLYSTVGDLAKLVALQIGFGPDSVLRQETLTLRDSVPVSSFPALHFGYGLGFQVARWSDTVAVGHSGNTAGYTSQIYYDTRRKYGVIVLRSAAGGHADAHRLAGQVYRKLRSALPK